MKGKVKAVCISRKKGESKIPVEEIFLKENFGIIGDVHAGTPRREVSLLPWEVVREVKRKMPQIRPGSFGENITTEGIDFRKVKVGKRLRIGREVLLEVSQIGKKCPAPCEIYRLLGDCLMPREGIFASVIRGGKVKPEDTIEVEENG